MLLTVYICSGKWQCDIVCLANYFHKDIEYVKEELNRLQTMEEISYQTMEEQCSLIHVNSTPPSSDIDHAISDLFNKMYELQKNKVSKQCAIYRISRFASFSNVQESLETQSNLEQGNNEKHFFN